MTLISGVFHQSWKTSRDLRMKQEQCGLPQHKLMGDVATRWGSTYEMISRILEQQQATTENRKNWYRMPTDAEFSVLEAVIGVLKPLSYLRWRASNVTQPCNNWRRGLRFTVLERPSRSCRGHPWCHATCLVPRLSWASIDHVASWELRYTCFIPWRCPRQISAKYHAIFSVRTVPSGFLRYNRTKTIILTSQ